MKPIAGDHSLAESGDVDVSKMANGRAERIAGADEPATKVKELCRCQHSPIFKDFESALSRVTAPIQRPRVDSRRRNDRFKPIFARAPSPSLAKRRMALGPIDKSAQLRQRVKTDVRTRTGLVLGLSLENDRRTPETKPWTVVSN